MFSLKKIINYLKYPITVNEMILSICQPVLDLRYKTTSSEIESNNLVCNGYTEDKIDTNNNLFQLCIRRSPGGSCLNTMRMISQKSKIELTFVGAIGDDTNGNEFLEMIRSDFIDYNLEKINCKTAECRVLLNNNERSLVTELGAANKLSLQFLKGNLAKIMQARFIYICAFFVSAMPENSEFILDTVKMNQILVFNLSFFGVLKNLDSKMLTRIFYKSKIIIGNRDEFLAFYKILYCEEPVDDEEMIFRLGSDKFIICTNGESKVIYNFNGQIKSIAIEKINLKNLDTCGAGDYFAAGVIYSFYEDGNIENAIKKGNLWAKEFIIENSIILNQYSDK